MAENYYLITMSDDGDVYFEVYSKEQLYEELNRQTEEERLDISEFLGDLPKFASLENYLGKILIKGEIIVPKAVEVTTRFEVD